MEEIFERIQTKHNGSKSISRLLSTQSISETLDSGVCDRDPEYGGQINAAFVDDENDKVKSNSNNLEFGPVNPNSKESDIHPYVSSQMLRNMAVPDDSSSMKVKTYFEKTKQVKRNEAIESEFNEAGALPDEQINPLIKSLEKFLHDSPGTDIRLPLEQKINTLLTKLHSKPQPINQVSNHREDIDENDDYEKMDLGGKTNPIQTNAVHNTQNEVFSIVDSSDESDEPLTSLKSRRRRELQEEINKFVLSRGEKINKKNTSNGLSNSSDGIYTTTLEVNVDQNGHTHPTKPFAELQFDSENKMAFKHKSSTPLLENLAGVQKQNDRKTTTKKILHPPIEILVNDVAKLNAESAEKLLRDQMTQQPSNQDGDRVYSFNSPDKFGKRVLDRPKQPPPSSPSLFERVESHTQRTQLWFSEKLKSVCRFEGDILLLIRYIRFSWNSSSMR